MKKIICVLLSVILIMTNFIFVFADSEIKVNLDGNDLIFDVPPQLINKRTMVPLRKIFESLGAVVNWNDETQTATATRNDTTINITINETYMFVNDEKVSLDSPACLINNRVLVPVRAISEAFDTKVLWDDITSTVLLSTTGEFKDIYITMYATDGRTTNVKTTEVDNYKNVGWYMEPVTEMFSLNGDKIVIATREVDAYKKVGWYDVFEYINITVQNLIEKEGYISAISALVTLRSQLNIGTSGYNFIDNLVKNTSNEYYNKTGIPLIVLNSNVSRSDATDIPYADLLFFNTSGKTIISFDVDFTCYDAYWEPTSDYPSLYSPNIKGYAENDPIDGYIEKYYSWQIINQKRTQYIGGISIKRCAFADGTSWKQ